MKQKIELMLQGSTETGVYSGVVQCPSSLKDGERVMDGALASEAQFISLNTEESLNAKIDIENSIDTPISGAGAIIDAWIAMEVLSPRTFNNPEALVDGNRDLVIDFSNHSLPWETGRQRHKNNYRLYYHVILGSIKMLPTVEALLSVYEDTRAQRPEVRGEAVLASILVDDKGKLAEIAPISLSSFAWALPIALQGNLRNFSSWQAAERHLAEKLAEFLLSEDREGDEIQRPLSKDRIRAAYQWLLNALGLDPKFVSPPSFVLCAYQWIGRSEPPDPILLNSFFLNDLHWAKLLCHENSLPDNLKQYLGILAPDKRSNLLTSQAAVRNVLMPSKIPPAAWPGKGHFPLVLLQQCAVNAAMTDLKDGGMLAVNGPPGTGKTTLLRDIVAAIIMERAKILVSYDDPEDAFVHSGQKIKRGQAFLHLYSVDKKLQGYEVLVASSNNKAVENISMELPGRDAIADDAYFSTVANALWPGNDTWGVISAVLGNATNRTRFVQNAWWNDQSGLQGYLKHACGTPHIVTDNEGRQSLSKIVQNENPPRNHQEALVNWGVAKQHFSRVFSNVEQRLKGLQKIYDLYDRCVELDFTIGKHREQHGALSLRLELLNSTVASEDEKCKNKKSSFDDISWREQELLSEKPGWFSRIFFRAKYSAWRQQYENILIICETRRQDYEGILDRCKCLHNEIKVTQEEKQAIEKEVEKLQTTFDCLRDEYRNMASIYTGTWIDASFFAKSYEEQQKAIPWIDRKTARLRGDLFEAALNLHKAFIDGAAKPIRHNCNVFFQSYCTKSLGKPERDALISDLWSTFFLVVPVVSTTFASVERMLKLLGKESLGWLLIDEAGQALPQASVGALLRCKRTVVVGDPLQIEPIVTLPESLTVSIGVQKWAGFGVEK